MHRETVAVLVAAVSGCLIHASGTAQQTPTQGEKRLALARLHP